MADYTTTLSIVRTSGIGVEVFDEVVGTGDNSETSFDLDNGNIISGCSSLPVGFSFLRKMLSNKTKIIMTAKIVAPNKLTSSVCNLPNI